MSDIVMVRHGQAQTHARDEASYDSLSQLGRDQSRWLGAHFAASGQRFARVYTGSLTRHRLTLEAMEIDARPIVDPRLNELEYFTLSRLHHEQSGLSLPSDREGFVDHLPALFDAWRTGRIVDAPETFAAFETRVRDVLDEIAGGAGRALVVTSGGLIGMAMRLTLGLDLPAMCALALAIQNTSVHRFMPIGDRLMPVQFNALPHLEDPARQFAQTHL